MYLVSGLQTFEINKIVDLHNFMLSTSSVDIQRGTMNSHVIRKLSCLVKG